MERTEPLNGGIFTAAMLPTDYPAFSSEPPCARVDDVDRIFFPPLGKERAAAIEAKRVCRNCDVRQACAEYALRHGEVGTWGGLTDRDRTAIRRDMRRVS